MMPTVFSGFDSGSICVVTAAAADDIQLRLVNDTGTENFAQWFYFGVTSTPGVPLRMRIVAANQSAYPEWWSGFRAVASYNRVDWFTIETHFDGTDLLLAHTPTHSMLYIAYTTPYSLERHWNKLAQWQVQPECQVDCIGHSVQGRPLHLLTIGAAQPTQRLWITARQHCGETMAQWCVEGLVDWLLDPANPIALAIRQRAQICVVPNINVDGTVLGNHRHNAAGVDLNREWAAPSLARSPEVVAVQQAMAARGVNFFLDAHGDEDIPYVFLAARPLTPAIEARRDVFRAALLAATPEFQTAQGYTVDPALPINRAVAINHVAFVYDCPTFTLEMPFKDNEALPHPTVGWSAARSRAFGQAIGQALWAVVQAP